MVLETNRTAVFGCNASYINQDHIYDAVAFSPLFDYIETGVDMYLNLTVPVPWQQVPPEIPHCPNVG